MAGNSSRSSPDFSPGGILGGYSAGTVRPFEGHLEFFAADPTEWKLLSSGIASWRIRSRPTPAASAAAQAVSSAAAHPSVLQGNQRWKQHPTNGSKTWLCRTDNDRHGTQHPRGLLMVYQEQRTRQRTHNVRTSHGEHNDNNRKVCRTERTPPLPVGNARNPARDDEVTDDDYLVNDDGDDPDDITDELTPLPHVWLANGRTNADGFSLRRGNGPVPRCHEGC